MIALLLLIVSYTSAFRLINNNVYLEVTNDNNNLSVVLGLNDEAKLSAQIGHGLNVTFPETCDNSSFCNTEIGDVTLVINSTDSGFVISWVTSNTEREFRDCIDLDRGVVFWYGGPEKYQADWPIENDEHQKHAYVTTKVSNGAIAERYWLNSKGSYVFVDDRVPLFIDQNVLVNGSLCLIATPVERYIERNRVLLEYRLIAKTNPKEAHLHAVNTYLGKPKGHPDEWVIQKPIWTTWAKYKKLITDDIVTGFASDIRAHNFTGQIEIDDFWEICYGSLIFNNLQFPNINTTVANIHEMGFTVSLWVHPFVDVLCLEPSQYGSDHGYFVKSSIDGSVITDWWNSFFTHHIDFTQEEASKWFFDRLKLLQDLHGIDSFKFDAGESDWPPVNGIFRGDSELRPNHLSQSYARQAANFGGGKLEIRTGFRTQELGVLVRMIDKDSRWGLNNGLHALITSLLISNINGYVFVLPDMIGGNGYTEQPTAELLARWTQANTFMPAMQFSYLPWEFTSDDFDGLAIIQKYVALHEEYSDLIIEAMNKSITDGTPVNPPLWWVDPTNPDALKANDQYLLGEKIVVAPVVKEGATSRDVVIPLGFWKDGNNGSIYRGPQILKDYPAPIDVLPYFIRENFFN